MRKKECPSCAMQIDIDSKVCPICNYEFSESNKGLRLAAVLLVILFLLYLFYSLS